MERDKFMREAGVCFAGTGGYVRSNSVSKEFVRLSALEPAADFPVGINGPLCQTIRELNPTDLHV
jgi:hypothetical protein